MYIFDNICFILDNIYYFIMNRFTLRFENKEEEKLYQKFMA